MKVSHQVAFASAITAASLLVSALTVTISPPRAAPDGIATGAPMASPHAAFEPKHGG